MLRIFLFNIKTRGYFLLLQIILSFCFLAGDGLLWSNAHVAAPLLNEVFTPLCLSLQPGPAKSPVKPNTDPHIGFPFLHFGANPLEQLICPLEQKGIVVSMLKFVSPDAFGEEVGLTITKGS